MHIQNPGSINLTRSFNTRYRSQSTLQDIVAAIRHFPGVYGGRLKVILKFDNAILVEYVKREILSQPNQLRVIPSKVDRLRNWVNLEIISKLKSEYWRTGHDGRQDQVLKNDFNGKPINQNEVTYILRRLNEAIYQAETGSEIVSTRAYQDYINTQVDSALATINQALDSYVQKPSLASSVVGTVKDWGLYLGASGIAGSTKDISNLADRTFK